MSIPSPGSLLKREGQKYKRVESRVIYLVRAKWSPSKAFLDKYGLDISSIAKFLNELEFNGVPVMNRRGSVIDIQNNLVYTIARNVGLEGKLSFVEESRYGGVLEHYSLLEFFLTRLKNQLSEDLIILSVKRLGESCFDLSDIDTDDLILKKSGFDVPTEQEVREAELFLWDELEGLKEKHPITHRLKKMSILNRAPLDPTYGKNKPPLD